MEKYRVEIIKSSTLYKISQEKIYWRKINMNWNYNPDSIGFATTFHDLDKSLKNTDETILTLEDDIHATKVILDKDLNDINKRISENNDHTRSIFNEIQISRRRTKEDLENQIKELKKWLILSIVLSSVSILTLISLILVFILE